MEKSNRVKTPPFSFSHPSAKRFWISPVGKLHPMKQLPNIITLSRLVFLVAIAILAYESWAGAASLVFFLCLAASISDWLDGFVARRCGYITNFGKLMDAITDKVFVIGLFAVLLLRGMLGRGVEWLDQVGWIVLFITILRDLVITGIRMLAARRGVVLAADKMGKRKTIWQSTAICVLFAVPMFEKDFAFLGLPQVIAEFVWVNGVLYFFLGGILTVLSGAMYFVSYLPHLRAKAPEEGRAA
jgi:CDP-diacylglycerol--glycerol-3-phosphate 3-phosphatidyltransferase